jgi:hypothetical protein
MAGVDQVRARVEDHGAASAVAGSVRNCRIAQAAPRSRASWPAPRRSSSPATSACGPVRAPPGQTTTTCSPLGYSAQRPRRLRAEQVGVPSGMSPVWEDLTDHLPVPWDRQWWPDCADPQPRAAATPSRRRPPIGSRKSGRPSWAGRHAQRFNGCSGELVASCLRWTKWCTDAVEVTQCLGIGAEHGRLGVGEVVPGAERPD